MADPIQSNRWTGDLTYADGQSSSSSDFERLMQAERREVAAMAPELKKLRGAAVLLLISPVALWIARTIVHVAVPDNVAQGYDGPLGLWTMLLIGIASWQLASRPVVAIRARRFMLNALALITIAGACLYGFGALESYARATASAPERTFEIYRCTGRCRMGGYFVHQRVDGTTIEGEHIGAPLAYGITCTEVQKLTGRYGFTWVRVLERTKPPEHQILWPISREDCFSDRPIGSLKR